MKKIFYLSVVCLFLFEIANIYFIMPLPGSQEMNSIGWAYFLYTWRWFFRILFGSLLLIGLFKSSWKRKISFIIPLIILVVIIYFINFKMAADAMFLPAKEIHFTTAQNNQVDTNRLVIGVIVNGIAKAYPIQFLGYHHFISDTINGKPILVTYCTVCRTGMVFDPTINNKVEHFRLVGMDHFNAMIEDETTKTWWRQGTGEAIAGKLKGSKLKEIDSKQTSLALWLKLYPSSYVMQADQANIKNYDTSFLFESGKSRKKLTGTDSLSWQNKSWVVGLTLRNTDMAFDWNELRLKRILQSNLVPPPNVFLVLAKDQKSFFAFENESGVTPNFVNDTIYLNKRKYTVNGVGIDTIGSLKSISAYQQFWHSWKTFHPNTLKY